MQRQAIIIGLGQFGMSVARALSERGVEVLAVDNREERGVPPLPLRLKHFASTPQTPRLSPGLRGKTATFASARSATKLVRRPSSARRFSVKWEPAA